MPQPCSTPYPDGDSRPIQTTGDEFYHGTSKRNARKILKEGFRDWSWTAETPKLKYKARRGEVRWMHGGFYGRGTYVTRNWRSALHFGPVLFRVEVQPGTRIVRLDMEPDVKVMDSLKREFGKEILTKSPWKVLPANKKLTLSEAIQLARHHVDRRECTWQYNPRGQKHEALMHDLRKILVRYGIQGWGDPVDLCGIVIFATDRIKVREVVFSLPTENIWWDARISGSQPGPFASLDAMLHTCRTATNRGATISRKWVEQANQELQRKFHSSNSCAGS